MKFRTLVHIGYHKTASSFLQKEVFSNPNLSFNLIDRSLVTEEIIKKNLFFFNPEETLSTIRENFLADKINVISAENLVGNPHSGGYNSYDHFLKLKQLFPDAKILICIREQGSMILSTYNQYIRSIGILSLRKYLAQIEKGSNILPAFDLRHFCYDRLIDTYVKTFGKENVLVLPYELLNINPRQFLKQLFEFAGLSEDCVQFVEFERKRKTATPHVTLKIKRIYNILFTRTRVNPRGWLSLSTQMDTPAFKGMAELERKLGKSFQKRGDRKQLKIINKAVNNFFVESNRRTMDLTNIDLDTYNYRL